MSTAEDIAALEMQIYELSQKLCALKKDNEPTPVPDYEFDTLDGTVKLSELFGAHDELLLIHNMGQRCRYCTLWADGINGILPHLESTLAVALVSKDTPEEQRRFANARGWRFRLASHGGGAYMTEQSAIPDAGNMPGAVAYTRKDGQILRRNACAFGPYDLYCPAWHLLALAGISEATEEGGPGWTPQYNYWQMPAALEDGGTNLLPAQQ